jgi:signal transduction histidine kinase
VDVERIGQVILNLLSNARKYSSSASPIYVSLQFQNDTYSISVRDSGVGIPSELLAHIFDRFYRVPTIEVQTGSSVGFGLGLYISKQIVEHHGGSIHVESTPGVGSTFTITLPILPQPASSIPSSFESYTQSI